MGQNQTVTNYFVKQLEKSCTYSKYVVSLYRETEYDTLRNRTTKRGFRKQPACANGIVCKSNRYTPERPYRVAICRQRKSPQNIGRLRLQHRNRKTFKSELKMSNHRLFTNGRDAVEALISEVEDLQTQLEDKLVEIEALTDRLDKAHERITELEQQ